MTLYGFPYLKPVFSQRLQSTVNPRLAMKRCTRSPSETPGFQMRAERDGPGLRVHLWCGGVALRDVLFGRLCMSQ